MELSSRCGIVLDEQTARELLKSTLDPKQADEIMERLIQDIEFRDMRKWKLEDLSASASSRGSAL